MRRRSVKRHTKSSCSKLKLRRQSSCIRHMNSTSENECWDYQTHKVPVCHVLHPGYSRRSHRRTGTTAWCILTSYCATKINIAISTAQMSAEMPEILLGPTCVPFTSYDEQITTSINPITTHLPQKTLRMRPRMAFTGGVKAAQTAHFNQNGLPILPRRLFGRSFFRLSSWGSNCCNRSQLPASPVTGYGHS